MPDSNKPRLYVAMHPTSSSTKEEPKYHWALIIGPKSENQAKPTPGTQFHVKNTQSADGSWQYDEQPLEDVRNTPSLLARVLIAKVEDEQRLVAIFRNVPLVQGDLDWRCRHWIVDAIAAVEADGKAVGTSVLQWQKIQETEEAFVAKKVASGRYQSNLDGPRPLFDLLKGQEIVP